MAVKTAGGPLLGGVVTDSVGWRWNFPIVVPIAAAAIVPVPKTLHLPIRPARKVSIAYIGATLIAGGPSATGPWRTSSTSPVCSASSTPRRRLPGAGNL